MLILVGRWSPNLRRGRGGMRRRWSERLDLDAASQSLRSVRQHLDSTVPLALIHGRFCIVRVQQREQGYRYADYKSANATLEKKGGLPKNSHRDASRM